MRGRRIASYFLAGAAGGLLIAAQLACGAAGVRSPNPPIPTLTDMQTPAPTPEILYTIDMAEQFVLKQDDVSVGLKLGHHQRVGSVEWFTLQSQADPFIKLGLKAIWEESFLQPAECVEWCHIFSSVLIYPDSKSANDANTALVTFEASYLTDFSQLNITPTYPSETCTTGADRDQIVFSCHAAVSNINLVVTGFGVPSKVNVDAVRRWLDVMVKRAVAGQQ